MLVFTYRTVRRTNTQCSTFFSKPCNYLSSIKNEGMCANEAHILSGAGGSSSLYQSRRARGLASGNRHCRCCGGCWRESRDVECQPQREESLVYGCALGGGTPEAWLRVVIVVSIGRRRRVILIRMIQMIGTVWLSQSETVLGRMRLVLIFWLLLLLLLWMLLW